jgi:hydrogenase expression/formation protein HypE
MITLADGSGGRRMHRLIRSTFVRYFDNPILRRLEDAAEIRIRKGRLALTTDSFVVQPLFFPGGDIGKLAVCGTVNDLAVKGASPRYLSTGFIISSGFPLGSLERICRSMAVTARNAGAQIVTGDTKVIETGQLELFINTSGVGSYEHDHRYEPGRVKAGDRILINGSIGDHEAAVVLARGQFEFKARLKSDCAPLNGLIRRAIASGADIKMMRDPTRGGVATTLNEIADASGLGIIIHESALTVKPEVHGVCELLGLEPLYLANEGKALIVAARRDEDKLLSALRRHPLGREATVIAEVTGRREGVWLETRLGSLRPVLMLEGQQLPRIC